MTINAKDINMQATFGGRLVQTANLVTLSSDTLPPESILYGYPVSVGEQVTYDPVVQKDGGGSGTVTFNSLMVPTITGQPGMYALTYEWDGRDTRTAYYPLTSEASIIATHFSFLPQDAGGWTIIPAPDSNSRIAYIDPINGSDVTGQIQSLASITGDWRNPASFTGQVFASRDPIAASFFRDGEADYLLFVRGQNHDLNSTLTIFNGGKSATAPHIISSYGAGFIPNVRQAPGVTGPCFSTNGSGVSNVGFFDLWSYPDWHNPDSGSFIGWSDPGNDPGHFISLYPGDGANVESNFYIENIHCNFTSIGFGAGSLTENLIIRRCSIANSYSEFGHQQGLSGDKAQLLLEDVIIDHCGWYEQADSVKYAHNETSGTHTAATSTTFMEDNTADFTGADLTDTLFFNNTTGATWRITGVASTTRLNVELVVSGSRDDWQSGDVWDGTQRFFRSHGQANVFTHDAYLREMQNTVIRNVIFSRPSSIGCKLTSFQDDAAAELLGPPNVQNFIMRDCLQIDGEIGFGGFGNKDYDYDQRERADVVEVVRNVVYKLGVGDSTARGVADQGGFSDTKNGLYCGNIVKDSGGSDPAIDQIRGVKVGGHNIDYVHSRNVVYNSNAFTSLTMGCFREEDDADNFSNVLVKGNHFQQVDDAGVIIGEHLTANNTGITYEDNRYYSIAPAAQWAYVDGVLGTIDTFTTNTSETGHTTDLVKYNDTTVSIENYMLAEGETPTIEAFINNALLNEKGNYDQRWTAEYANAYFRYGMSEDLVPDVRIEAKEFDLSIGAVDTTQDFTFTNVGQVKGVIIIRANTRSSGGEDQWLRPPYDNTDNITPYGSSGFTVGFADASGNQWCWESQIDSELDGGTQPNQVCQGSQIAHACIRRTQGGLAQNEGVRGEWALDDTNFFGNNRVTIKVTEQPDLPTPEEWNVVVIAFGGDDIDEIIVGNHALGTGTAQQQVTVGHEPDLFIGGGQLVDEVHKAVGQGGPTFDFDNDRFCFGMAINKTGQPQSCSVRRAANGSAVPVDPSETTWGIYDDAFLAKQTHTTGENYSVRIDGFNSTGVLMTQDATGDNANFGYFSVKFKNKPRMAIANTSIPTSGNLSISAGFQPGFALGNFCSGPGARNTAVDISGSIGLVVSDGTETYTVQMTGENNTNYADSRAVGPGADNLHFFVDEWPFYNNDGGVITFNYGARSSSDTFTATGIEYTLDKNPAAAILGSMLFIEANN